jgi:hypothetical protein
MASGRPSLYTPELGDKICEKLAEGKSMRYISRLKSMPSMTTLFKWLREIPEFTQQYEKAKIECHNAWFEETMDIPDNQVGNPLLNDEGEPIMDENGNPVMHVDAAAIQHARLRVDTRKWALSKIMPKKYGDRVTQDVNINNYTELPDDELARKLAEKRQEHEQSKVH